MPVARKSRTQITLPALISLQFARRDRCRIARPRKTVPRFDSELGACYDSNVSTAGQAGCWTCAETVRPQTYVILHVEGLHSLPTGIPRGACPGGRCRENGMSMARYHTPDMVHSPTCLPIYLVPRGKRRLPMERRVHKLLRIPGYNRKLHTATAMTE